MFKNYFTTAWRNLKHNKIFSILNISGLAVGIACASLIFLWVEYFFTFNQSVPELNNLYNVKNNQVYGKDMYTFSSTPFKIKEALEKDVPGVVSVSRCNETGATVSVGTKYLSQSGAYVDSAFLKMFDFSMKQGDVNTALNQDKKIAISEKLSNTYFENGDALNQTIVVDNQPYMVSAIFKNREGNEIFNGIDWLLPYNVFYAPHKDKPEDSWGNNWTNAWVLINPNANINDINRQVATLAKKNNPETNNSLFLYPLNRITLYGGFVNGKEDPSLGQIKFIKMFMLIAFIILLIACINFMNLSTARSEKRAKEIGVRKVLGSGRKELIMKFLFESVIISYVAVALSVVIVALAIPAFSHLINIPLKMNLFQPTHILFLVAAGLLAGLIAGSYPSLYLSSFNPIRALKKQTAKDGGNAGMIRKGLVVVQFAISVVIIVAVALIYQQIQYTKQRDLGFTKDNILYVGTTPKLLSGFSSLKQNLLNTGMVSQVTLSNASPMAMYSNGGGFTWNGKNSNEDVLVTVVATDNSFNKTFGIGLKDGREFSETEKMDSTNVIINESLAKLMGKEGHVGAQISQGDGPRLTVIGITKDFLYNDVSSINPAPLLFYHAPSYASAIYMRVTPTNDVQKVIGTLQSLFKNADATVPFDYHFLDDDFDKKFKQVSFISSLATIFGGLAIFISCLGLFGLSAFMAEQRTKEIGVRKVLGASVSSVTLLLSKDFLMLVLIACIIAFPLAYWAMNNWLMDYQYRIKIGWYVFGIAGAAALFIAFLTVSFQTIKAALANPVKSLRSE
jgi:predicted permease